MPLGLPDSPRKLVFRLIVKQLRNDAVLRRALKVVLAWDGNALDDQSRPLTLAQAPGIRLTPTFGPDLWQFPEAMSGWMFMRCEILIPGMDVGDGMDLWWAIQTALYPPTIKERFAFQRSLVNVTYPLNAGGAKTGQIEFSQPFFDDDPKDQYLNGFGEMKVEMLLNLNTDRGIAPWPANG